MIRSSRLLGAVAALVLLAACSGGDQSASSPAAPAEPASSAAIAPEGDAATPAAGAQDFTPVATPPDTSGSTAPVRIAAVGDMVCSAPPNDAPDPTSSDRRYRRGFCQYKKVSDLLLKRDLDRFLPLGDLQYYVGSLDYFRRFYGPSYGRVMNITSPAPGNHESYTVDKHGKPYAGYRAYFGKRAHWNMKGGSYSYNLGGWHIISMNTEWCENFNWTKIHGKWEHVPVWPTGSPEGCREGDPLHDWLTKDLEANADTPCTLAYFHHPAYFWVAYAGGPDTLAHDGYTSSRPLYRVLYRYGADVVLTGHHHFYERLLPINPEGELDPEYGFTQFVVGTGGDTLGNVPAPSKRPEQVAAASDNAFGILRMDLQPESYSFRFVPAAGNPGRWRTSQKDGYKILENGTGGEVDSGEGTCHGAPPQPAT